MNQPIQENLNHPDCIRTFSGIYINVFEPAPSDFNIEDIAHALAHQCRFGGHLPVFYSVAQHSVHCAGLVSSREDKLAALMHDASEAYLLDIPRPIKNKIPQYKEVEANLMKMLSKVYGFEYPVENVKKADETMLEIEWEQLVIEKRFEFPIRPWAPEKAKRIFLETFNALTA